MVMVYMQLLRREPPRGRLGMGSRDEDVETDEESGERPIKKKVSGCCTAGRSVCDACALLGPGPGGELRYR